MRSPRLPLPRSLARRAFPRCRSCFWPHIASRRGAARGIGAFRPSCAALSLTGIPDLCPCPCSPAAAPKGFNPVVDQTDNYQFLYPFGWQEVSVSAADVVFKDVVEPLESVSVTITDTDKGDISEFGDIAEVRRRCWGGGVCGGGGGGGRRGDAACRWKGAAGRRSTEPTPWPPDLLTACRPCAGVRDACQAGAHAPRPGGQGHQHQPGGGWGGA